MMRRTVAALLAVSALTGCSAEVVDGQAVSRSPSAGRAVPQSGARFTGSLDIAGLMDDVSRGVAAVNTYDYRSLDSALANGLRYTSGRLSADFKKTFDTVIRKNAPAVQASQQARVNNVGVASISGTSASLLVFGQLNITTKDTPTARVDPFAVVARAHQTAGRWRLVQLTADGSLEADPPGTSQLATAVTAARTTATALSSYRRANFDADFDRSLALVTAVLRADLAKLRETTRRTLRTGGFDLTADVRAAGVEEAAGSRAVVLVSLDGYRVKDGVKSAATRQNLRITTVLSGGRWLVDEIKSVGVS